MYKNLYLSDFFPLLSIRNLNFFNIGKNLEINDANVINCSM